MTNEELTNWVEGEEERLDEESKKSSEDWRKDKGLNPLYSFEDGVLTTVKLFPVKPYEDSYGRKNFTIEVDGLKYDTAVTVRSPHYREWIHKLREAVEKDAPIEFKLLRSGKGQKDTRYNFIKEQVKDQTSLESQAVKPSSEVESSAPASPSFDWRKREVGF